MSFEFCNWKTIRELFEWGDDDDDDDDIGGVITYIKIEP
jgi:hypothetical protein